MRRLGVWGFGVTLLVALGMVAVATAADDDDDNGKTAPKQTSNWFSFNWFGQAKKAPDSKKSTTAKPPEKKAEKKTKVEEPPSAAELAASQRALEEAALLRRDDVCDRLMEIAMQTNNAELANRAEQLKQKAWEVYLKRTANLPSVTQAANSDLDEMLPKRAAEGRSGAAGGFEPAVPARAGQPFTGRGE
jgi:hypothetical protein